MEPGFEYCSELNSVALFYLCHVISVESWFCSMMIEKAMWMKNDTKDYNYEKQKPKGEMGLYLLLQDTKYST